MWERKVNKEILQRYATLKIEDKRIKNEIDFLKPQVLLNVMAVSTTQPVQVDGVGTFSLKKLKTWEYSPELTALKARVAEMEAEEKQNGKAQFTETDSVVFKEMVDAPLQTP